MQNNTFLTLKDTADALKRDGKFTEAIEAYDLAITERPQFWGARYEKADTLLKQGNYIDAAHTFLIAWLHSRNRAEPLLMCGRSMFQASYFKESCDVFELVPLAKFDPLSALMYANALTASDRAEEALKLEPIFQKAEDEITKTRLLAYIYRQLGQIEKAHEKIKELLVLEPDSIKNNIDLADLLGKQGNVKEAVEQYQRAIGLRLQEYQKGTTSPEAIGQTETQPMLVFEASKALLSIKEILDANDIKFFLAFGSLLGIYRDGELLPYDKDMDLGIDWSVDRNRIYKIFADNPHFKINSGPFDREKKEQWNIVVQHRYSDITIDLFFFKPEAKKYVSGFYHRAGSVQWAFSPFKTKTLVYRDQEFQVPENPEQFFTEIYGPNWGQPDKYFDSVLSGHNATDSSTSTRLLFGYARLFNQLDRGNWSKARAYIEQINAFTSDLWLKGIKTEIMKHIKEGNNE